MTISEKIFLYRKKAGLSQEEFAERLSVSRQAVSKWETGESVPETMKLFQIAGELGITADFLLDEEQESFSAPVSKKKAWIDGEAVDRLTAILRKYGWLAGLLPAVFGIKRLIVFLASLPALFGILPGINAGILIPYIFSLLTGLLLIACGIVIIVKLKPKKE